MVAGQGSQVKRHEAPPYYGPRDPDSESHDRAEQEADEAGEYVQRQWDAGEYDQEIAEELLPSPIWEGDDSIEVLSDLVAGRVEAFTRSQHLGVDAQRMAYKAIRLHVDRAASRYLRAKAEGRTYCRDLAFWREAFIARKIAEDLEATDA